jgi:hypothetical protein
MEAGSKEWHEHRAGCFNGSENHKLMGEKGGVTTATAQTYIMEKVAETLTGGWHDDLSTVATRWGNDLEPEASMYYELAFSQVIEKPDPQSPAWSNEVSGSPDGIVYNDSQVYGIEFKCPYNPANHVKHMLIRSAEDLKATSKEYYWQILTYMLIFELPMWEFVSFDPRFTGDKRMHVVEIKRSQVEADIDRLHKTLLEAIKVKHEYLKRIEM